MATDEITPNERSGGSQLVSMEVFKGRGQSIVDLGKSAPFGWWPVVVLALVSFMDRLEQSVLAGAVPSIKEHFDVGNGMIGLVAAATSVAGLVLFVPAGRIADRTNRTRALALVLVSWSLLSIGTGLAISFIMLLMMRTLIGAAGQLNNPAGSSLLADYYPGKTRTKVFAIERYVYFLANPIGVVIGAVVADNFGWRWVFLGLVLPGLVVALFCWFLKEPLRGTSDRIDAMRLGQDAPATAAANEPLGDQPVDEGAASGPSMWEEIRHLWKVPTLRSLYIGQAILYFGLSGLFFFTPTFLYEDIGLDEDKAGAIAGGIGLVGVSLGVVLGIKLGNRYHRVRPGWRLTVSALGISVGVAGVVLLALAQTLPMAVMGFGLVNVGFMIAMPNLLAAVAETTSVSSRGMSFSINQVAINAFGAVAPSVIGFAADQWGFNVTYACTIPPLVLAAVLLYRARAGYDRDVKAAGGVTGSEREIAGDSFMQ